MKNTYRRLIIIISMFFCVFPVAPVMSQGFDFGTKFGASLVFDRDKNISSFSLPSSVPSLGASLPSLYATWYPTEHLGMTADASYGTSSDSDSIGSFGIDISGLVNGFESSTPYGSFGTSLYGLSSDKYKESLLIGFDLSAGYIFNIDSKFTSRLEAQYGYLIDPTEGRAAHKVSLVVSIGTLFSY